MDNIAFEIISSYADFEVESSPDIKETVVFKYGERRFALLCPEEDNPSSSGLIFALDDATFDLPHIFLQEIDFAGNATLPRGKYRYICLYESGSVINALLSYEDKIVDSIERLIELLTLSPLQKEREFQKEFLVYWNASAKPGKREVYLDNVATFSTLTLYQSSDLMRYVAPEICLRDLKETRDGKRIWQERVDIAAIFLPIINNRGIVPPTKDSPWGKEQIKDIISSDTRNHIRTFDFLRLEETTIKYDTLDIVFGITIAQIPYTFLVRVNFRGGTGRSLLDRLCSNIHSVEMLQCKQMDYHHLNQVIGNDVNNTHKKVVVVGAGSLGSYVASELAKNGFCNLSIYDGDDLDSENFMRWYYSGIFKHGNKAIQMKLYLELMHPEICVEAYNKNIDGTQLTNEMLSADYIIFTIGSSDAQLLFNRILQKNGCKATVIFAWLEAGGEYSHLLKVDYAASGCFECLFTDDDGNMVNNQGNFTTDEVVEHYTIRTGCGATRAAYGTSILLRTTSVLLDVLNKEKNEGSSGNYLVNISPHSVIYDKEAFIKEACRCCGN